MPRVMYYMLCYWNRGIYLTPTNIGLYIHRLTDECIVGPDEFKKFILGVLFPSPRPEQSSHFDFFTLAPYSPPPSPLCCHHLPPYAPPPPTALHASTARHRRRPRLASMHLPRPASTRCPGPEPAADTTPRTPSRLPPSPVQRCFLFFILIWIWIWLKFDYVRLNLTKIWLWWMDDLIWLKFDYVSLYLTKIWIMLDWIWLKFELC
jgi:hypothetical protein